MKPPADISPSLSSRALLLAPTGNGWRLCGESEPADGGDLATIVPQLPAPTLRQTPGPLVVALPTHLAFFERLTLPSGDREELEGMVLLQLEKTLPYPIEETSHRFEILSTRRETAAPPTDPADPTESLEPITHSTIVAWAIHLPTLESTLAPLLQAQLYPSQLTLWAMHLAACSTGFSTAAAFWQEQGGIVFAIFEKGKVAFTEMGDDPETAAACFPQWLLSAELAGAPVAFERVWIDPALDEWRSTFTGLTRAPAQPLPFPSDAAPGLLDLSPASWLTLRRKAQNRLRLKKQLLTAAALYAVVILGLIGWNLFKGFQLRRIEGALLAAQPQAEERLARELRWRTLAPAVDAERSTVELLFRVFQSLPSPEVRITEFEQTPKSFMVTGEAPNAAQAVEFLEKMKAGDAFADFELHADPPTLLPNEHAQFRIFGK